MKFTKIALSVSISFLFCQKTEGQITNPSAGFNKAYELYREHSYARALRVTEAAASEHALNPGEELVIKGVVLLDSISFARGKIYFDEAAPLLAHSNIGELLCLNYYGLGIGYLRMGDFKNSIRNFMLEDYYATRFKLPGFQRSANTHLGINYQKLRKIPIANAYVRRALEISIRMKDTIRICSNYALLTGSFVLYSEIDTNNIKYGDSILKTIKEYERYSNGRTYGQMGELTALYGNAFMLKREYAKAVKYCRISAKYFLLEKNLLRVAGSYYNIGAYFLAAKNYDSSLFYMQKADQIKGPDLEADKRIDLYNYYEIYKALGKPQLSLEYLEKYVKQNDEISNGLKALELQQMRENFETQKTDQRIISEKEKSEALFNQKRNFYLYCGAGLFFVLILTAYLAYYRFTVRKEKEKRDLKILLQNAELTALKAQMNPHFIFNALNSIQHSIVTNDTDNAFRFLSKFSKLIRNILDSSSAQLIPLKTEIETLSLYVDIESKRFDGSFSWEINVEENGFSAEETMIPPMMLQPFIENAIWHGLMPKEGEKSLIINFRLLSARSMLCEITDNGIGMEKAGQIAAEKRKTHKSKGIANIMDRIKLLEITHSIKANIIITDLTDAHDLQSGTRVSIKFS